MDYPSPKNMTSNQWSNKTASDCVAEFHVAFGHPIANEPAIPADLEVCLLRERLIEEEYREVMTASWQGDLVNLAKELADLIYVIHGMALAYGIPLDEVFDAVHASNMSKLGEDGKPILRDDGKVMKGPDYKEPDIGAIINGKTRKTA